uniref:Uncharacterized protein n=1 Tax=Romanomermis culicivorax TaxID=13658 RepID=A0A915L2L0_ROMCU
MHYLTCTGAGRTDHNIKGVVGIHELDQLFKGTSMYWLANPKEPVMIDIGKPGIDKWSDISNRYDGAHGERVAKHYGMADYLLMQMQVFNHDRMELKEINMVALHFYQHYLAIPGYINHEMGLGSQVMKTNQDEAYKTVQAGGLGQVNTQQQVAVWMAKPQQSATATVALPATVVIVVSPLQMQPVVVQQIMKKLKARKKFGCSTKLISQGLCHNTQTTRPYLKWTQLNIHSNVISSGQECCIGR